MSNDDVTDPGDGAVTTTTEPDGAPTSGEAKDASPVADGVGMSDFIGDEAATPGKRPRRSARRRSRTRGLVEWVAVLLAALLIAVGLRTFAFQVFFVPSTSMVPTLLVGDRILVDKFLFNYHSLARGDVIVFARQPKDTMCGANETDLVKRVIGLPGQTISENSQDQVLINGSVISEPYLPADDPLGSQRIVTEKIPADQFYVLGDNRSVSCDSRYWGTVSGPSIVGRVISVIWRNNHPEWHGV